MDKISCGGFYLGEGLELDGKVLKATGEGGTVMFTWLYDDSEPDFTPTDVANAIKEGKAVIIHIMDDPDSPDTYGYDTYLNATYHAGRVSAYFAMFDIVSRNISVIAYLSGTVRDDEWDYVK